MSRAKSQITEGVQFARLVCLRGAVGFSLVPQVATPAGTMGDLPLYPRQRTCPRIRRRMALCAKSGCERLQQDLFTNFRRL